MFKSYDKKNCIKRREKNIKPPSPKKEEIMEGKKDKEEKDGVFIRFYYGYNVEKIEEK